MKAEKVTKEYLGPASLKRHYVDGCKDTRAVVFTDNIEEVTCDNCNSVLLGPLAPLYGEIRNKKVIHLPKDCCLLCGGYRVDPIGNAGTCNCSYRTGNTKRTNEKPVNTE